MKKKGDFRNYCFKLMKMSLMTGFPVIAESKNSVRRTVKVLVLLICNVGFFYQTWSFLDMYLQYPTITDVTFEQPEQIEAPAITICNANRLLRQRFCKALPDKCEFKYEGWDDFCKDYPVYCSEKPHFKSLTYVFAIVTEADSTENRSNEVLNALGPQEEDLIFLCLFLRFGNNMEMCWADPSAIQATSNGFPYKCFSLFSLLGKPDAAPQNLMLTDKYKIFLSLHPEEYLNPFSLFQAAVFIHDPRSVANPLTDGIALSAGFLYRLYVTMEKRESLPSPYESNCTDYLATWRKNGGYGPLTKKDCTEWCKIQAMVNEYGCVSQIITYPNNFAVCSDESIVPSGAVNALCSASCNDACDSSYYTITTEISGDIAKSRCKKTDEHCQASSIQMDVVFNRMNIQKSKLVPKFQNVELFSYIGGYMGMWIGISLVSIFDLLEMLLHVLAYPVIRYNKKKKINQVQRFQRNIPHDMYNI